MQKVLATQPIISIKFQDENTEVLIFSRRGQNLSMYKHSSKLAKQGQMIIFQLNQ
jgi:hypothetical protein